jgi:ABC-type transport system substrate-binding protein
LLLSLGLLAACTNTPPPPLVSGSAPRSNPAAKPDLKQIVVGVDNIGRGYNPHKVSDASSMTTALADAMLPSVFRPAPDGSPMLDRTVMESAEVTSAKPFTVSYVVRTDASWSDGVPVRAEDFQYLRDQMANHPGVVDPAGYRLISSITSQDNGRVVQVHFSKPYPGWRSLFTNLLPGHVLKDAPGGWGAALSDGYPSTAGPFQLSGMDRDRGEITLERNERYWGRPAAADSIVLRRSDVPGVSTALRSGDNQLALVNDDAKARKAFAKLGDRITSTRLPRNMVAQVDLRPVGPLSEQNVRRAVAAALDRQRLITAGGGDQSARADALTYAPSERGYRPTMPADAPGARPSKSTVISRLESAGYTKTHSGWTRDGTALRLTVAAIAGHQPYVKIAKTAVQELTAAGVSAKLITPSPDQLNAMLDDRNTTSAAQQDVNVLVGPRVTGGDPAGELAAQYGCAPDVPGSAADGTPSTYPASPTGVCDQELDPKITAVLTGQTPLADALPSVERSLWEQAYSIPLFQQTELLAVGKDIEGVQASPAVSAPFPSAAAWRRTDP